MAGVVPVVDNFMYRELIGTQKKTANGGRGLHLVSTPLLD